MVLWLPCLFFLSITSRCVDYMADWYNLKGWFIARSSEMKSWRRLHSCGIYLHGGAHEREGQHRINTDLSVTEALTRYGVVHQFLGGSASETSSSDVRCVGDGKHEGRCRFQKDDMKMRISVVPQTPVLPMAPNKPRIFQMFSRLLGSFSCHLKSRRCSLNMLNTMIKSCPLPTEIQYMTGRT